MICSCYVYTSKTYQQHNTKLFLYDQWSLKMFLMTHWYFTALSECQDQQICHAHQYHLEHQMHQQALNQSVCYVLVNVYNTMFQKVPPHLWNVPVIFKQKDKVILLLQEKGGCWLKYYNLLHYNSILQYDNTQ